jgi:hypothetical protein
MLYVMVFKVGSGPIKEGLFQADNDVLAVKECELFCNSKPDYRYISCRKASMFGPEILEKPPTVAPERKDPLPKASYNNSMLRK